jgi:hypothetical protein
MAFAFSFALTQYGNPGKAESRATGIYEYTGKMKSGGYYKAKFGVLIKRNRGRV